MIDSHLTLTIYFQFIYNSLPLFPSFLGLIPNATQMVQPLDLSFFKPFKVEYKRRAEAWRRENGMASINLVTFPSIALPSYSFCLQKESIQNGFRKAGIYPWNPDAVDYSRAAAIEAQAQVPDPLQGVDIAGSYL